MPENEVIVVLGYKGSGTHWLLGVCDSEERAQELIEDIGPTSVIKMPVKINENYYRREIEEYEKRVRQNEERDAQSVEGPFAQKRKNHPYHILVHSIENYDEGVVRTLCGENVGKNWSSSWESQEGLKVCPRCMAKAEISN